MLTPKQNATELHLSAVRSDKPHAAFVRTPAARGFVYPKGVKGAKDGRGEVYPPSLGRNPVRDMQIVRVFQDGAKVVLHCHQNLNSGDAQPVTADFFDPDADGQTVAHWGNPEPVPPNLGWANGGKFQL